jgi:hypothetical protein
MPQSKNKRQSNRGLTVRLNLWPLDKKPKDFKTKHARLWMRGHVTNLGTKEHKVFNDAGDLISTLGKWNAEKLRELRRKTPN